MRGLLRTGRFAPGITGFVAVAGVAVVVGAQAPGPGTAQIAAADACVPSTPPAGTASPAPSPGQTPTPPPADTATSTATGTATATPTNTPTSTATATPTNTPTSTPTNTPVPPTPTPTNTPTTTPVPPTPTPTNTPTAAPPTPTPTDTPTPGPTATAVLRSSDSDAPDQALAQPAPAPRQGTATVVPPSTPTATPPTGSAPVLCSFTLSRDRFKVARGKMKATAAARGTTLRLESSAAGTATVSLRSRRPGLRINGRCRVDSPARRKRVKRATRCQRPFDLVVFERAVPQGASSIRFTGRLQLDGRTKRLYPGGPYVLTVVVQDAAGRTSAPRKRRFTILP